MKVRNLFLPAVAAGLMSIGGMSHAQVLFNYTSSTVFNSTGTNVFNAGPVQLTVGPEVGTNDNAIFPGTDVTIGAIVATANPNAPNVIIDQFFTTTLTVLPLGVFAGTQSVYTIMGEVQTTVNGTQVNNTFIGINSGQLPQTVNTTVGLNNLTLTTSGFTTINDNDQSIHQQSAKFAGISNPGDTPAGGFTIHISGAQGQTTNTPEPGAVAMLVGMGVSGSAFVLRRRRAIK